MLYLLGKRWLLALIIVLLLAALLLFALMLIVPHGNTYTDAWYV